MRLYDNRVKLLASAEAEAHELYDAPPRARGLRIRPNGLAPDRDALAGLSRARPWQARFARLGRYDRSRRKPEQSPRGATDTMPGASHGQGKRDEAESVGIAAQMADIRQPPMVTRDAPALVRRLREQTPPRLARRLRIHVEHQAPVGMAHEQPRQMRRIGQKQQGLAARFDPERQYGRGVWPGARDRRDAGDEFVTIAIPDQIEGGPLRIGENPREHCRNCRPTSARPLVPAPDQARNRDRQQVRRRALRETVARRSRP